MAEAFGFVGLAQYVDTFLNYARTELDPAFDQGTLDSSAGENTTRLTVLLIVEDPERARAFYEQVLGVEVVRARDPLTLRFHNSWIIAKVGGEPTADKPGVSTAPPMNPGRATYALNIRVSDARAVYEEWRSRGAHFLTPPVDHGSELRCYLRDSDGHLIEVGQTVG